MPSREGVSILHAKETGKSSGRLGLFLLPFTYSNDKKLMIMTMMKIKKNNKCHRNIYACHVNERELKFLPLSQPCVDAVISRKVIGKSERDNP